METVLITGSTSGIGKELAELFATKKYNLILAARNKTMLQQIAADLEQRFAVKVNVFNIDLSLPNSAEQLYESVKIIGQRIDILVNNAGVGVYSDFTETNMEELTAMLMLNMISLTKLTHLFANDMKQQRKGKILNVSSTAAFQPAPHLAAYAASKAYVLSLTEALHIELGKYGISVTALCPGPTATNFAKQANMESSKLFAGGIMTSKEVAEQAYKALMQNKMTLITGLKNKIQAGAVRLVPRKWAALIAEQLMR